MATLTNATPEIADFPHTTWKPTPGMISFENIQIQIIDTPPLDLHYVEPELLNLIRRADLILVVLDLLTDPLQQLEDIVDLLKEYRIVPVHFKDRYIQTGMAFIPFLLLLNKNDDKRSDEHIEIFQELLKENWPMLSISAKTGRNLELLKQTLFKELKIIRVYSKAPGKGPDRTSPFILKQGSNIENFAAKVHKDFAEKLKLARVWGKGVYDGQPVQRNHLLHDGDVVELHI